MQKDSCLARGLYVVGFSIVVATLTVGHNHPTTSTSQNECIHVETLKTWNLHADGICYVLQGTRRRAYTVTLLSTCDNYELTDHLIIPAAPQIPDQC